MNGQPLFRFQLSEKSRIQEAESRRLAQEHMRNSQPHSMDSKQMSSQRSLTVQVQQNENEHMSTLSARLHQEADKIRKWKIQTELDLKDKVKKLAEASLQIDIMKKSLLELQLENERTSSRLQEEIGSREDVIRRINGTREMCSLLQSHASKVDDRLAKCETERIELKYVGKENMQLIEEVTKQFHDLQVTTAENKKKLQSQTSIERNDRLLAEKAMKSKIDTMETELQKLQNTLTGKGTELCVLLATLQEKDKKLQIMEKEKEDLERKVSSLHEELVGKEEELKESSLRISSVQDDKCRLEKMLKGLEHEFNSLQIAKDSITLDMTEAFKKLEERLQNTTQDAESTRVLLEEEQHKLKTCKDKLAETSTLLENLKITRDSLMLEKIDIEMQLDLEKFQMNNILTEKAEDKDEIHRLNGEIVVLTKKLDKEHLCRMQAQDEIDSLQARVSTFILERDDHIEEIVVLKDQLTTSQEKIKSLESLLSEEEHKTMKLHSDIDKVEKRIASDREHLQQAEEQIVEFKQEINKKDSDILMKDQLIENLKNDLQSLKLDYEEKEKELKASSTELEGLRSQISKQCDKIKDLMSQLNYVSEQSKETDISLASQQKIAAETIKQNKALEKELKNVKADLEKEKDMVKERSGEILILLKEVEHLRNIKENLELSSLQCEEEIKKVREQCQQEQEAARLAIKKAEEMQESAQKEKHNALALTDCQLAEMMATLDTYKQNNEKLISEKDVEIQTLRSKLENAESLAFRCERELSERKKEIEHLKSQVASKTAGKSQEPYVIESDTSEKESRSEESEKQSPKTPAPITPMKTPQSSILRSSSLVSASKRRKVAFLPDGSSQPSSSEESDLMEFNTECVVSDKICTTVLSPKARNVGHSCMTSSKVTPRRIPMSRLSSCALDKQIFPDTSTMKKTTGVKPYTTDAQTNSVESRSKIMSDGKILNIRKTPAKRMSKIFTTSPRNKALNSKTKIKEKTKQGQMAWFELDSIYGFSPED